jgi:hypothetical protein
MDPISEEVRAIQDLLRHNRAPQPYKGLYQQIEEQQVQVRAIQNLLRHNLALQPHKGLYQQIEELVQRSHDRSPELWRFIREAVEMRRRVKSISSSASAPSKWKISSDQNVPAEFKRKCLSLLQANPRLKEKVLAVSELIAAKSLETSTNRLKESNHPIPELYNIQANAIFQFLRLAEEHYRLGKGPVTKGELWDRVCDFHVGCFKSGSPTHRYRILRSIGLHSLPERLPGRPRK